MKKKNEKIWGSPHYAWLWVTTITLVLMSVYQISLCASITSLCKDIIREINYRSENKKRAQSLMNVIADSKNMGYYGGYSIYETSRDIAPFLSNKSNAGYNDNYNDNDNDNENNQTNIKKNQNININNERSHSQSHTQTQTQTQHKQSSTVTKTPLSAIINDTNIKNKEIIDLKTPNLNNEYSSNNNNNNNNKNMKENEILFDEMETHADIFFLLSYVKELKMGWFVGPFIIDRPMVVRIAYVLCSLIVVIVDHLFSAASN